MSISGLLKSAGFIPCAFLLGVVCAAAQVLLFRELMVSLYGNELIFVGLMAAWSAGIACGGVLGRRFRNAWGVLFSGVILLVLVLWACRYARSVLGWPVGVTGALFPSLLVAGVLVFSPAFCLGACFAAMVSGQGKDKGPQVYAVETLGFAAGALLMVGFLVSPFCAVSVEARSPQWPGYRVVAARETPQASWVVVERQGERSLFENGSHVATTHDRLTAEENVHYALLAHPLPRRVLLIGGAASGAIEEALKYPGLLVDVVEPDPAVFDLVRSFFPDAAAAIRDPRVRVLAGDARRLVRTSSERYDVIIVLAGEPYSLLVNRYFTADLFADARARLAFGGILCLSLPASENYVNEEGRRALGGMYSTLASVFSEVRVIPGGKYIFLASGRSGGISVDPAILAGRLKARGIMTQFVRPEYFNDRLGASRLKEATEVVAAGGSINLDIRPSGLVDALAYWATRSGSLFSGVVEAFRRYGVVLWLFPVLLLLLVRKNNGVVVPAVIGFGQMSFQTAVVMLFQSAFGNVYSMIGLLTAGMMLGLFAGTRGRSWDKRIAPFLAGAFVFAAAAAWVPWIAGNDLSAGVFFLVFPFLAGVCGGRQFALAVTRNNAAKVYSSDVLGSGAGALFGGLFLIPLWGIPQTLLFAAALQLAVIRQSNFD